MLLGPATALALNINEEYKPQNEFKLDPWISIGPIEINKAVFYVIVATRADVRHDGLRRAAHAASARTGCRRPSRAASG